MRQRIEKANSLFSDINELTLSLSVKPEVTIDPFPISMEVQKTVLKSIGLYVPPNRGPLGITLKPYLFIPFAVSAQISVDLRSRAAVLSPPTELNRFCHSQ